MRSICFSVLSACAFQAMAADPLVDEGVKLMKAGNAQAAYALLEPQESARAGDKEFDLLFALAALQVGQNTRAIFALERILAIDPQNVRARAELGRAYLAVGETQAARTELQSVKQLGVPNEVEKTIDGFLAAVERLENEGKTSIRGYIEGTFGYDTNVNAAPSKSEAVILGSIPITLSSTSRAAGDWFASLGGGVNVRIPVDKSLSIVGGVSGTERWNKRRSDVDTLSADANLGVVYTQDKNSYSLITQASSITLENDRYRESLGFTAQWQHYLDARNQLSAFGQYGDVKYVSQPIRNAERWVWGVGYAHALRDGTIGFGSLYTVREDVRNTVTAPYLGLKGFGLRLGAQTRWNDDTTLFASAGYEVRRHKELDPTFALTRGDDQATLSVGATHALKKDLKVTTQYARTDQRSNTDLNRYERDLLSVSIRQDF